MSELLPHADGARRASRDDLSQILGDLDDAKLLEILALEPSVEDVEEAAMWAAGQGDLMGKQGHPLVGTAARVFDILTANEEEEPPPSG